MKATILPAVLLFVLLSLVTGVLYPLAITGITQLCCARAAQGSLIVHGDQVLGSTLIGQEFDQPQYFWSRLSATTPAPYNGASSTGSNLGPTNPALSDAVKARVDALRKADPQNTQPVPIDLATASASGLDPHISPAAADYQVARVARTRGLDDATVRALVKAHTDLRQWGVFGEPRVNVLELNLALDARR